MCPRFASWVILDSVRWYEVCLWWMCILITVLRVQGTGNRCAEIRNSLRKVGEGSVQKCFSELAGFELEFEGRGP